LKKLREEESVLVNDVPEIMVMEEMSKHRDTHLLKRGAYDAPGDAVEPDTPGSVMKFPADAPRNRLGLAQWLTDRRNPLTARVAVNRIWKMHFGRGLVATPDDFGSINRSRERTRYERVDRGDEVPKAAGAPLHSAGALLRQWPERVIVPRGGVCLPVFRNCMANDQQLHVSPGYGFFSINALIAAGISNVGASAASYSTLLIVNTCSCPITCCVRRVATFCPPKSL